MMILKMRNFILIFPKLFWGATAPKTTVKGRGTLPPPSVKLVDSAPPPKICQLHLVCTLI